MRWPLFIIINRSDCLLVFEITRDHLLDGDFRRAIIIPGGGGTFFFFFPGGNYFLQVVSLKESRSVCFKDIKGMCSKSGLTCGSH